MTARTKAPFTSSCRCGSDVWSAARDTGLGPALAAGTVQRHGAAMADHATAAPPCALAVVRLSLTQFRCYAHGDLDLDGRPVVLTGPNGAGKTNVLEALSLLAPGRGLRNAAAIECARRGPDAPGPALAGAQAGAWAVAATLRQSRGDGEYDETRIGTGIDSEGRRVARVNGAPAASSGAFTDYLRLTWLTPVMDRLFLEGASGRRRFLDRLVLGADPAHGKRAAAYERAMRERTRLLKAGGTDDRWLSALEAQMAEHGTALAQARRTYLAGLAGVIDAAPDSAFPKADVALEGDLEARLADTPADRVETDFAATLRQMRGRDGAAGRALSGPHRSDLLVTHRPKAMPAGECSTGEQKALLVGIILANARLRAAEDARPPVLLLDEIAAHLDAVRRAALFDALCAMGAQAWMTGTDPDLFAALGDRAQFIAVADAAFRPAPPPHHPSLPGR